MKKSFRHGGTLFSAFLLSFTILTAQNMDSYITTEETEGYFTLARDGNPAPIAASTEDHSGVLKIIDLFRKDIGNVTGKEPHISLNEIPAAREVIIIGTIGKSKIINDLAERGKLDVSNYRDKWENFLIYAIEDPFPSVKKALVIAGSDKRGTIFGMFDVSREIGVSPWYWWADVPVQKKNNIFVKPGVHSRGTPAVRYRGIFINDEAPALTGWVAEKFGSFNHKFYEKVFELILRLHGNYLWPAMWRPRAIYVDDPKSPELADEMGVVLGTSHHEPMMRAHDEWSQVGKGPWNYESNAEELQKFWRGGIERMGNNESIVTVGMRGDGDEAMAEGTVIELLGKIVSDQRKIIEDVTGRPAAETPQLWALYKEVQDYYDKGMRVPQDVLLLLCDDNWGNIRVLPQRKDWGRKGGFGIYYHFDFVGGPVSYRWLNVTQIEKVWEQMNLAYQWHAREMWLVNVGDIKPMELPISFFLDFAWNAQSLTADKLPEYYVNWAAQQFGPDYSAQIAEILKLYTKYNARRTPEMIRPDTYSLVHYREAERVLKEYNDLVDQAKAIYENLSGDKKDAFYQLVLFPVEICANLNEMYVAAAKNRFYHSQERASTNVYAARVKELFRKDSLLTEYFHHELAGGKWNHMMSQTHIGYTSWNNPPENIMPEVETFDAQKEAHLGVLAEGLLQEGDGPLPEFDALNKQKYYVEIFNKGMKALNYTAGKNRDWIKLSSLQGVVRSEERIFVEIDWQQVPAGRHSGTVTISDSRDRYVITVTVNNQKINPAGFIENNGVVSINAANYKNAVTSGQLKWLTIPNMGRTHSSVTISPATAEKQLLSSESPHLQYEFTVFEAGEIDILVYVSPTLNFMKGEGLGFAVSIDDQKPQIINMHEGEIRPDWTYPQWWNQSVTDHIKIKSSRHTLEQPGSHVLKIWMVDPGVVFQKFVIDAGGLKGSYLGPPQSVNFDNEG